MPNSPIDQLRFSNFEAMVGTYNRGQVAYDTESGALKKINHHFISRSQGRESAENYAVREQFLKVVTDRLGARATKDYMAIIRHDLGLDQDLANRQALPLSRRTIQAIVTDVNRRVSVTAGAIDAGRGASPRDHALATAAVGLFGGDASRQSLDTLTHPSDAERSELRARLQAIVKEAVANGAAPLKLSRAQLDNLINTNVLTLSDRIYQDLQKICTGVSSLNGGKVADFNELARDTRLQTLLAAEHIRQLVGGESGEAVAEGRLSQLRLDAMFAKAGKPELLQGYQRVVEPALVQFAGVKEKALWRRLDAHLAAQQLPAEEQSRLADGVNTIIRLSGLFKEMSELLRQSLRGGLDGNQVERLTTIGNQIHATLAPSGHDAAAQARLRNLQQARQVMRGTHLDAGIEHILQRLAGGFSYENTLIEIGNQTLVQDSTRGEVPVSRLADEWKKPVEQPKPGLMSFFKDRFGGLFGAKSAAPSRPKMPTAEEINAVAVDLKGQTRTNASLLLAERFVSELVSTAKPLSQQEDMLSLAREVRGLAQALRGLRPSASELRELTLGGERVLLLQHEDGTLCAVLGNKTLPLPYLAAELAEQLELDMARQPELYGHEGQMDAYRNCPVPGERMPAADRARCRQVCITLLTATTRLSAADVENLTLHDLHERVGMLLNGTMTEEQLVAYLGEVELPERINGEEALQMLEALGQLEAEEVDEIVKLPAPMEPETNAQTPPPRQQRLQNFIADLLYGPDTWRHDQTYQKPSVHVKETIQQYSDILAEVIKDRTLLDPMPEMVRTRFGQALDEMLDELLPPDKREALDAMDAKALAVTIKGVLMLKGEDDEALAGIAAKLDEVAASACETIRDTVAGQLRDILGIEGGGMPEEPANLDDWLGQNATDIDSNGTGRFISTVLSTYFTKMQPIDQRAMLASAMRNNLNFPDPESREAKAHLLGSALKGAGPLLQKLLQGLPTDKMPKAIAEAFKDMKSKLAPIPDHIVKAQLLDIRNRSNGRITSIEVTKSLGAASVGQTFLCRIHTADGPQEGVECAIKLLRPDVANRLKREVGIFTEAAESIPGMKNTFAGQLARIQEELNLTVEARNVHAGAVYSEVLSDVSSMRVSPLATPTTNCLVLEKAPGETVDRYLDDVKRQVKDLMLSIQYRDGDGNPQGTEDEPILNDPQPEDYCHVYDQLTRLYDQVQARQLHVLNLANRWVSEGLYGNGFYHGDLHAGNIMVTEHGATAIDFGNATRLTEEQQVEITKMCAAASIKKASTFCDSFYNLLSPEGKREFGQHKDQLRAVVERVFAMGDVNETGQRIAVALNEAQKLGLELPGPIFNFSQCQMRLQNTIKAMNDTMVFLKTRMKQVTEAQTYASRNTDSLSGDMVTPEENWQKLENCLQAGTPSSLSEARGLLDPFRAIDGNVTGLLQLLRDRAAMLQAGQTDVAGQLENQIRDIFRDSVARPKQNFWLDHQVLEKPAEEGLAAYQAHIQPFLPFLDQCNRACQLGEELLGAIKAHRPAEEIQSLLAQLRPIFMEVSSFYRDMNEHTVTGAIVSDLHDTSPEGIEAFEARARVMFEGDDGPELRRLYEDVRLAQNSEVTTPEEVGERERAFLDAYFRKLRRATDQLDRNLGKNGSRPENGTFFTAMVDVLKANASVALGRIGWFTAFVHRNDFN
ncbi:MAG: AarF/UbiB family protein [Oligosphaeraceae bacterium]